MSEYSAAGNTIGGRTCLEPKYIFENIVIHVSRSVEIYIESVTFQKYTIYDSKSNKKSPVIVDIL